MEINSIESVVNSNTGVNNEPQNKPAQSTPLEEAQNLLENEGRLTAQEYGTEALKQSLENDPTAQIISLLA